jgi:hypothetical protein
LSAKSEATIPDVTADAVGEFEKGTTANAAPNNITDVAITATDRRALNVLTPLL